MRSPYGNLQFGVHYTVGASALTVMDMLTGQLSQLLQVRDLAISYLSDFHIFLTAISSAIFEDLMMSW